MDAVEELFDPRAPVQQSRVTRLCLSFLDADPMLSAAVHVEVAADSRGPVIAYQALVAALVEGLVGMWVEIAAPADVAALLRSKLAELSADDGGI
jgi:hypothetical protein